MIVVFPFGGTSPGALIYSKTCFKQPLSKIQKIGFQDQLSLNAGQKYCRMPQGEHSAILLTFIKLPFAMKIFVLSIFEWPLKTGFAVVLFFHTLVPSEYWVLVEIRKQLYKGSCSKKWQ